GDDRVIPLEHQRSMFYELASRNSDVPEGVPAVQVEVGSAGDSDDQDKRINVVYLADLNLPRGVTVQAIHFKNTGPYPIRFRSVIFGSERRVKPSELANSPLQLAAGKALLKKDHLDQLRGMHFAVYRNGSLARSSLDKAGRERRAVIPAAVRKQRLTDPGGTYRHTVDEGDARVFGGFLPMQGDRNVVLGVWAVDSGFGHQLRFFSLLGAVLSLLSAPFLLLLFNDALGWLSNLRLRLMVVVSVAALVPLAVLFVYLVRVLEGGHEDELQRTLRQSVRTVSDQLRDRQKELLESARSWVKDLRQYEVDFRKKEAPHSLAELKGNFKEVMGNQLPPEWKRGFLRLEYVPEDGAAEWLVPFTIEAGDVQLRSSDTALRDEPGVYKSWGEPIIGVRFQDGPLSLSVARHLGSAFLKDISPGLPAVLCDPVNGYQLAASHRGPQRAQEADPAALGQLGENSAAGQEDDGELYGVLDRGTSLMRDRATVPAAARETRQPVFRRHRLGGRSWIAAYDVIRNPQGGSGAMLGVLKRDSDATLTLAVGAVPVRTFFIAIAGFLLVLSLGLASVVTSRITDPIERLEDGAESLRRGEFDVKVESQEGGQIGRLTETFNNMAHDLRGRIQDLTHLNRGIQELTSRLDLDQILASAIAFFSRHSPADRVRFMLLDYERDQVEIYGATRKNVDRHATDIAALVEASGPMCIQLDGMRDGTVLEDLFPEHRSVLAMPLVLAGRPRGCVMLLFEAPQPGPVNLELLSTIAAQTAAAIENARLYKHAVEDLYTGAYVPDYFSRLVRNSVALAQEGRREMALIGLRLTRGDQLEETLGVEGYGRYMERVARCIRAECAGGAKICRSSSDSFQLLLPEHDQAGARDLLVRVETELRAADLELHGSSDLLVGCAVYPEDGASAEFLFHALESKLSPDALPAGTVNEPLDANGGLILNSPVMSEVVRVLKKVAPSDLTILLAGETGTGKEVLTNLLHKWSKRARGPLVKVHCAALPSGLLESELFGHEKGAFTGATHRKIGKFEQANGGTLFLDEIAETSLEIQVKLLRVLQEREVDRVGGVQPVHVDVRVVTATNRNIEEMVADGSFREDLYYRLQGMVLTVPPLRDRRAEIPGLVEVFRREAVIAGHTAVQGFSTDAMDELYRQDWPGNIRELRNSVFRAMVLAGDGLLDRSHLLGILPRDGAEMAEPETEPEIGQRAASREPTSEIPAPEPPPPAGVPAPGGPESSGSQTAALSGRLARLLELIAARGSLSNQEYAREAGVSLRTGLRDLNDLLDRGLIRRVGRRRGARYFVKRPVSVGGE
ncbi:MAG: sigma 54-interacting transcriptional regulator, partial [Planctomycetota bacterium]|nr:sigma 54-interacting transcriptional regulator [Planctomycetota bacterium]